MILKELRSWKKVYESDLSHIAYELKEFVDQPAFVILDGEMGAGKTSFVKAFTQGESLSPTYSVVSETANVIHCDFYRLKTREEILHLELPLYLENKDFLFIEWGKDHYYGVCSEIPEEFEHYMLAIDRNEASSNTKESRNFVLYSVAED